MENFKRARTSEQLNIRKSQIKDACLDIFENEGYENISFTKISEVTNLARTAIYKHYKNKDEILLDVIGDLTIRLYGELSDSIFDVSWCSENFDLIVEKMHRCYLNNMIFIKLRSLMFLFIEKNSRIEKIVEYKYIYSDVVPLYLKKVQEFSNCSFDDVNIYFTQLNYIICSIYPMTNISDVQKKAMDLIDFDYSGLNFESSLYNSIKMTLSMLFQ